MPPSDDPIHYTPRERQILQLLWDGHNRESICHALDMALDTLKQHLKHMFRKAEVNDYIALAMKTYRQEHDCKRKT